MAARAGERRAARPDGNLGARQELREQVAPNLFRHLDVNRFPSSTLDALALANRAYRTDLQVGEQVSFALRDALFEEGRDISDRVTLEYLARDLGVVMPDESDGRRNGGLARGQRRGVLGSPHFFCGDADVFCPSLDITKDPVKGASIVRDASRLTEFLARCLAQPDRHECDGAAVNAGLTVEQAEQAVRVVDTDDGPREAIDAVVRAKRAL